MVACSRMAYLTMEAEIDHGRIIPKEPEKLPADQKLAGVREELQMAATAAAEKAKAVSETKTAAEKVKADAEVKSKEAQSRKETTAVRAKETAEKAKPKEVTIAVYSAPIGIKVRAAEQAKAK